MQPQHTCFFFLLGLPSPSNPYTPPSQKKEGKEKRTRKSQVQFVLTINTQWRRAEHPVPSPTRSHQLWSAAASLSQVLRASLQLFPILTFLEGCITEAFSDSFLVMNLHSSIPLQRSFLAHRSEWQHGSRTSTWFPVVYRSWISTWFPVHTWKFRLTTKSVQYS